MSKPVIGILGGIGAGKSTVAAELGRLGCRVIDADAIGHQLLDEADVRAQIVELWGEAMLNEQGRVDRSRLAGVVFSDPRHLATLNGVMHGRIRHRMEELIEQALADESVRGVAVDAAVLLEAGWDDLCTVLVFVDAPSEVREKRVIEARRWSASAWAEREKLQISLDKKAARCQYRLRNSSCAACLREQVRRWFEQFLHSTDRSG